MPTRRRLRRWLRRFAEPDAESPPPGIELSDGVRAGRLDVLAWAKEHRVYVIPGAVVLVGLVVAMASFAPLVRAAMERRAEALGVEVEADSIRPGWGAVHLRDLTVKSTAVPSVSLHVDRVTVTPSWSLGVARFEVHGGTARVDGAPDEVLDQVRRARKKREPSGGGSSSGGADVEVDGLDVVWKNVTPGKNAYVWGLRFSRRGPEEVARVDLARLAWGGTGLEVVTAEVGMRRTDTGRVLSRVSAASVEGTVDLDDAAWRRAMTSSSPATAPVKAAAAATSLGRGKRLRQRFAKLGEAAESALEAGAIIDVTGIRFKIVNEGQLLNVGPGRLSVRRDAGKATVQLVPSVEDQKAPLTLALEVPLKDGPVTLALDGGPVKLSALGVREGDMGLVGVGNAEIEVRKGSLRLAPDGSRLALSGLARVHELSVEHPKLAPDPVKGLSIGISGNAEAALDGKVFDVKAGELQVGKVRLQLDAHIERDEEDVRANVHARVPLGSCQNWLDSTPEALVPLLRGMRLSGTFSFDGRLGFDTQHPKDVELDFRTANDCRISSVPGAINPERFRGPWRREVEGPDGEIMEIESGPGSADFVPLHEISRHMETAVLVCEDSRFWTHEGFDHKAIRDSIRDNLVAGRFVRGASTISMQLAKNLYLGREKTLSRKLQEAALTMLLEQEMRKDTLLELYLNVIEFGPGVYGIGPAARYYFESEARDLSLGQCLYLASILPNPKRQHFTEDGHVTERWSAYLQKLMHIAQKIHRITDDELEAGLEERVAFGQPYLPEEPTVFDESDPSVFEMLLGP